MKERMTFFFLYLSVLFQVETFITVEIISAAISTSEVLVTF